MAANKNTIKTTVIIPSDIYRGLRQYMVNHDCTSHDQSTVIVDALREYLELDGVLQADPERTTGLNLPVKNLEMEKQLQKIYSSYENGKGHEKDRSKSNNLFKI